MHLSNGMKIRTTFCRCLNCIFFRDLPDCIGNSSGYGSTSKIIGSTSDRFILLFLDNFLRYNALAEVDAKVTRNDVTSIIRRLDITQSKFISFGEFVKGIAYSTLKVDLDVKRGKVVRYVLKIYN
jgi:hypothetical protein